MQTSATNPEDELHQYLLAEASRRGFSSTKTNVWVNGMKDLKRGAELVPRLLRSFELTPKPDDAALEIGCGFGGVALALQKHFSKVSALDIVEERVHWTKRRAPSVDVACASATRLPYANDTFLLTIANDVFEHISHAEQHAAAREIYRVLVPGGCAFVDVPNRFQLIDEHNFLPFATWLPTPIRRRYVRALSRERDFVECWERTGRGWTGLFEQHGFRVRCVAHHIKNIRLLPPQHWQLFIQKPQ